MSRQENRALVSELSTGRLATNPKIGLRKFDVRVAVEDVYLEVLDGGRRLELRWVV